MTALRRFIAAIAAGLTAATMAARPGQAIDYQPGDWIPFPPGTNVAMGYYEFSTHSQYNSTITGTAKSNTDLYSNIGLARYIYYNEIFGHPFDLDVIQPFGRLTDGKIDGYRLGNASGAGDLILSPGFWFISRPEQRQWLSAATYTSVPVGSYDNDRALNLGNNRWQNDLQGDLTLGLGDKFTFDVSADWTYYGDNDNFGTGHQKLTRNSTYAAYAWLSYDVTDVVRRGLPGASNASISIGYAGLLGGEQKIARIDNGMKTREDQLRLTCMMFVSPTWQCLVSVGHDIDVSGQFKQSFGLTLRVAKTF